MNLEESIMTALEANINLLFFELICGVILLGVLLEAINRAEHFRKFLPGFSISLGIFGTFLGIFLGLSNFNTSDISASIPELLDGMKLAFFSSLVGLLGSFILQIIYNIFEDIRTKGSADPAKNLQNIELSSISIEKSISELEKTIRTCFKSDEEYSLVSQVKLIRQELIDSRRETKQAFQEFAEQFSKMASESIVQQLQQVIDKFNAMLNDLVAQSFIELRDSTERLNAWQAQYKDTIIQTNENLEKNFAQLREHKELFELTHNNILNLVNQMSILKGYFETIDSTLRGIGISGNELVQHTENLTSQNIILKTSLQEIQYIGEEAKKVIPEISTRMDEIITSIIALHVQINSTVNEITKQLSESADKTSETMLKNTETLTINLNENITRINTASTEQIEALERALENELQKSLDSLVGALASLSNKFVQDYTPLTDRLRELVRISEKVDRA